MNKSSLALVLVLAALLCAAPARAGAPMTMEQAVNRALEANPSMQAARFALLGSEAGEKSAIGPMLPSSSLGYGYTSYDHNKPNRDRPTSDKDVWTGTFNVHQDLFTGFRLLSTYEKASLTKENSAAQVLNTEVSLVQTVQQNFLALLKARADVKSGEDAVARLRDQLKVTTAFFDVGLKPRLDVLQAETDLASAEDTLLKAKNSVDTQVARLNTLLDLPLDAPVDYVGGLEYAPFTLPMDEALAKALKNRPDLAMAQKSVDIAHQDKRINDSTFYPQLGADFTMTRSGDGPAIEGSNFQKTEWNQWSAGVSASWKFFEWGKTYYASEQAAMRIKQLESERRNLVQDATYQVKANHLKVHEAADRIGVTRKALDSARESYRMAMARYQAQVGTYTDVLTAQASLTKAESDLTQALADYELAIANLYASMGAKNPGLTYN